MTTSEPISLPEQLRQLAAADLGLADALSGAKSVEAALQCIADASARTGITLDLDAARALLAHAEAQQQAGVELTDVELDIVAGAGIGQNVFNSVITLGIGCAIASLVALGAQRGCGDEIGKLLQHDLPPRDGIFRP